MNIDEMEAGRKRKALVAMYDALIFYSDPETYFAILILADPPAGCFMDDFSETEELGWKPGKRAREVLQLAIEAGLIQEIER